MNTDQNDKGGYHLYYPCYVLFHRDRLLVELPLDDRRIVPVFTDADLAETFVESQTPVGVTVETIHSRETLDGLLGIAEEIGATHVGIDVSEIPGRRWLTFEIGKFIQRASRG